jgi:hypothetical protein
MLILKTTLLTITISMIMTGCVGIGVVHSKTRISECDSYYAKEKNLNYLKNLYGEPKDITIKENTTSYLYTKDNMALRGVIPMIGIGIPLVLPIGTDYYIIKYKDEDCIDIEEEYTEWSGYMCGYLNENGKRGCTTLGK